MKSWIYFLVGALLIVLDQVSKWWVINHPFFLIKNSGIIFGWGQNGGIYILIATCLILGLFLFSVEKPIKFYWPITLIFAGAFSNLIDRIFRGGVIDFLKIINDIAFNFADIMVILGVILYVFIFFKSEAQSK